LKINVLAYVVAGANPSAGNIHPRSKDIDNFAMVGEGGTFVEVIHGANGDDSGLPSRRSERGVGEFVASCDLDPNETVSPCSSSQNETYHDMDAGSNEL
jgi:hypothetical protein